jgi:hypothetical protein
VQIVSPIPRDNRLVKRRLANVWVTNGRAVWCEGRSAIRLVDSHEENIAARIAAMAVLAREAAGYDAVNWAGKILSSAELRNIGIACPAKAIREALTVRTAVSRHFTGRSGPVRGAAA